MQQWLLLGLVCTGLSCESKETSNTPGAQKEDPAIKARLKQQATEVAQAFIAGDFDRVVDSTYPKNVDIAGGRDKLITAQKKARQAMTKAGEQISIDAIDEPGPIVDSKGILYSYVPITGRRTGKKGGFVLKNIFIAVSLDGGNNWKFIDDSGLPSRDLLKSILPDFPAQLVLPVRETPTLIDASIKK